MHGYWILRTAIIYRVRYKMATKQLNENASKPSGARKPTPSTEADTQRLEKVPEKGKAPAKAGGSSQNHFDHSASGDRSSKPHG